MTGKRDIHGKKIRHKKKKITTRNANADNADTNAAKMVDAKSRTSTQLREADEAQSVMLNRINQISSELSEASETQAAWSELLSVID